MKLTEFLLARIAEREATARDANVDGAAWWVDGPAQHSGRWWVYATGEKFASRDVAEHIALNDPAYVLARCKADRKIVEMHESWPVMVEKPPTLDRAGSDADSMIFRMSQQIAWLTTQEYRARFGDEPPTTPILAALALPHADHPDYDDEWRP